ncbi:helix-turn-helix domain-containing protein [Nocardiopsis sp. FR6]|uniref:helix-turn-helix domain-containing protein n=1 Tax=unclassified Nocardiopsis TaxID=2649073 RepID=UPI00351A3206
MLPTHMTAPRCVPESGHPTANARAEESHERHIHHQHEGHSSVAKNSLIPKPDIMRAVVEGSGMTHGQISVRAGCHRSTISRVIAGERRMNPDLAEKVALTLGVRTDLIFTDPLEPSHAQRGKSRDTSGRAA